MLRLSLAWVHLLALGIGLGAVWSRAGNLSRLADVHALKRAFVADAWWGVAAGAWIATGLWRLLAGTEKGVDYYMSNHLFFTKMGLLVLVLALEIVPMVTLIKWRRALAGNAGLDVAVLSGKARTIAKISYIQCLLAVLMVLTAIGMARGFGTR